jgi:hypothetical protein
MTAPQPVICYFTAMLYVNVNKLPELLRIWTSINSVPVYPFLGVYSSACAFAVLPLHFTRGFGALKLRIVLVSSNFASPFSGDLVIVTSCQAHGEQSIWMQ